MVCNGRINFTSCSYISQFNHKENWLHKVFDTGECEQIKTPLPEGRDADKIMML
jgi:hypothetical protein